MDRKVKAASQSGALLLISAGVLVGINALSVFGGHVRKDVTNNERYTLSDGSARLISHLDAPIRIEAYVTKGLPKLDAFVRDLRDLLQEYKTRGGGKFEFVVIEAKTEDEKKAAKEAGLVEQPFGEADNSGEDKMAVSQGFMGLVFKYKSEKDAIKFIPPNQTDGLEFWITNKIREIHDKADEVKHKVGVLTGHDEMKLTEANLVPAQAGKPSMQQIVTQNFPFYAFEDVDLKGGDAEIDDTLDGLIITQPGKEITEKELRRIDQFVLKGKSLAIFASAVNVKDKDPKMSATLKTWGLEKLLDGYGIEMRKDAVIDYGRAFRIAMMTNGGAANIRFPQMLDVQDDPSYTGDQQFLDTSFAAFFRLPSVTMPFVSSLVIHREKQPDIAPKDFKIVARSTPRSVHEEGDTVDLQPFRQWRPKGTFEQFGIAATVEGTLKTAFPEGEKQGVDRPDRAEKPARVLVIASSQFLANPFARAGNGQDMQQMGMQMPMGGDEQLLQIAQPYAQGGLTNTILSFKNTLDWVTGDTDLLAVSAKILNEPHLVYGDVSKQSFSDDSEEAAAKRGEEMKQARKLQQRKVEIVLIAGLPILFALFGIVRWRWRSSQRESLSLA